MSAEAGFPGLAERGVTPGNDRPLRETARFTPRTLRMIAPGLTLKGLRHTAATTLREAGLDERRIADLPGQKTPSTARHYSRSANLADKSRETMATLEQGVVA